MLLVVACGRHNVNDNRKLTSSEAITNRTEALYDGGQTANSIITMCTRLIYGVRSGDIDTYNFRNQKARLDGDIGIVRHVTSRHVTCWYLLITNNRRIT